MILSRVHQLRDELQAVRRSVDTPYGKMVMRRLSIFITYAIKDTAISPSGVTMLSVVSGSMGALCVARGQWVLGLSLVNLWYLLDHVDGELARYRKSFTVTGFYVDTIANVFVQPFLFFAMGWALSETSGRHWLLLGALAAYGSLMYQLIYFAASAVILETSQRRGLAPSSGSDQSKSRDLDGKHWAKVCFQWLQTALTFPNYLMLITLSTGLCFWNPNGLEWLRRGALLIYAIGITLIWPPILCHKILSKNLEKGIL